MLHARPAGSEALEQENKQLRAQLARAEMERDMLKKALTIAQMYEAHFHNRRADEMLHFHCLTCQANPQAIAVNKLATWPAATAPNQIWVGDITYLALATGHWAYLACWRDAFSRRMVGWHMRK